VSTPQVRTEPAVLEDVDTLTPHPDNPNKGDVAAIGESIDENGFFGSVIAQVSTRRIIKGEHTWRSAQEQGMTQIPVEWSDCDDDEALRFMLADNRARDRAHYDENLLTSLLGGLAETDRGLAGTVWQDHELEQLRHVPASYAQSITDRPITRGYYLISYPLDRHADVSKALDTLDGDAEITIRHAANDADAET